MYQELRDIRTYRLEVCFKLMFLMVFFGVAFSMLNFLVYIFGSIALFIGTAHRNVFRGDEKWNFLGGDFLATLFLSLTLLLIYRIANQFDIFLFEKYELWTPYEHAPLTVQRVFVMVFAWFLSLFVTAVCVTFIVYSHSNYFQRFLLVQATGVVVLIALFICMFIGQSCRRWYHGEQVISNETRENVRTLWNSLYPEQVEGVNVQTIRQSSAESVGDGVVVTTAEVDIEMPPVNAGIAASGNSYSINIYSRGRIPEAVKR